MHAQYRVTIKFAALALPVFLTGILPAHAVLIGTNPTLFTGPGAIDPVGQNQLDGVATGLNVTEATLEGRSDFFVINDFGTTTDGQNSESHFILFDDSTVPDIRFTDLVAGKGNGQGQSGAGQQTSSATSFFVGTSQINTFIIDFGLWGGAGSDTITGNTDDIFDTAANSVAAVGFAMVNMRSGHDYTFDFLDGSNNILSTASITGVDGDTTNSGNGGGQDFFVGHDAGAGPLISAIRINVNSTGGGFTALDDLGFQTVPIPEPSVFPLVGLSLFMGLTRRRR